MKKIIISIILIIIAFVLVCAVLFNFNQNKSEKQDSKTIRLAEVAHTIFYAPMYAAIENGYFEDYNIEIDLSLASGADKVSAALLSGDADIGFSGSETVIYVYNGGEKDYLKTFAQLTQKDGSFLVSREPYEDFTIEDLKGKTVIGGRAGHLLLNL